MNENDLTKILKYKKDKFDPNTLHTFDKVLVKL